PVNSPGLSATGSRAVSPRLIRLWFQTCRAATRSRSRACCTGGSRSAACRNYCGNRMPNSIGVIKPIWEELMSNTLEEKGAFRGVVEDSSSAPEGVQLADRGALSPEAAPGAPACGRPPGPAAIADFARGLREKGPQPRPRGVHLTTNIVVALDGDTAKVRSNWTVVQNSASGPQINSGGGYADELVKQNGKWLFRYRKIDRFIAA